MWMTFLKRFGMDECKAVVSSVDISTRLISSDAATKVNAPFREAVGALMHLMTATRPDIAYAVGYVSRFMENPQEETLGCGQAYLSLPAKAPRRMGSASSRVTTSTFAGTRTRIGLATSRRASRLPATRSY
ncbi:hypothetical protein Pcac1_g29200 [Phytophthora cactorum]|nr:hypothetical protein Pcac1_g29200 [Phytophthora cactorum]